MQALVPDYILQQNANNLPVKEFLQQLVNEYPYFTPAQFYLLQQTNKTEAAYTNQAGTTALLFNNPHWLQFQLQHPQQPATPAEATPVVRMFNDEADNDDDNATLVAVAVNHTNNENKNGDNGNTKITIAENKAVAATAPITVAETDINTDNDDDNAVVSPDVKEGSIITDTPPETKEDVFKELPAFEPMHLVDYFASQGIKLSEEALTGDKLGKQLKSFTEWLKTMKKIPGAAAPALPTAVNESAIKDMAEKSNIENEVLTEAMANVYAQQGKPEKAVALYQKLSLLNPSKNAYFAAKIEKLKTD
jgi:hypothetical protein